MPEEFILVRNHPWASAPTARDVAAVLFRERRIVIVSFFVILLGTLLYALVTPAYQAKMEILVRKKRVDPVLTPAPTPSPQFDRQEITEEELNSEVELLRDEEILRTVVRESGLMSKYRPWLRFWERNNPEVLQARAVRRLGNHLAVEPIRKTNLIAIRYESADPAEGAIVLQ
jgi:uncharacterized protein involved in exopolysaccharide biosynthesis